tara:strand:+ start:37679 stop:38422 length:744 start_codon:yes stop_codon:yes gene_type:complete
VVDLKGKKIIVTGGATGIGKSVALKVSNCGASIAVFDINSQNGATTVNQINRIGGNARYWHVDVSDEVAVSGGVEAANNWLGGIDILIHMAGILEGAGVEIDNFPENVWDSILDVNLRGTYLICKYVSPIMKKKSKGIIILASSPAGVQGKSSSLAYGASKGGVHGFTITLQDNLKKFGIRVNDIAPGSVRTPLKIKNVKVMDKKNINSIPLENQINELISPDDVANIIVFMASEDAKELKGTVFTN